MYRRWYQNRARRVIAHCFWLQAIGVVLVTANATMNNWISLRVASSLCHPVLSDYEFGTSKWRHLWACKKANSFIASAFCLWICFFNFVKSKLPRTTSEFRIEWPLIFCLQIGFIVLMWFHSADAERCPLLRLKGQFCHNRHSRFCVLCLSSHLGA